MAKNTIYAGTFAGREGTLWTAEIWQEAAAGSVGGLEFSGDEPLTIEWEPKDKEEPVCGSSATLHIISPGDRTYADLYAIKAGSIGLDVYRQGKGETSGSLYWRGTLDTELYEEPYAYTEDYEVELTFSDFGMLERLKYELTGVQTLEAILQDALSRVSLSGMPVDETLISTCLTAGTQLTLKDLSIRSENFTDEDGEKSDMRAVTEGILQPLGLKMTQKGGKIWIYDLNGLYTKGATEQIKWHDDDQTMCADKVANRVKVTFSPYADAAQTGSLSYTGSTGVTADMTGETHESHDILSVQDWGAGYDSIDKENISFRLLTSNLGSGLAEINQGKVYYYKAEPVLGSEDSEGVARRYMYMCGWDGQAQKPLWYYWNPSGDMRWENTSWAVMKTHRVWLPPMSEAAAAGYRLRIKMEMLIDARINPSEESGDDNNKDLQDTLTSNWNAVYAELSVILWDSATGGTVKASWDNSGNTYAASARLKMNAGEWKCDGWGVCRLEYYDKDDPYDGCGIGGWKGNRPSMGVRGNETGNREKATLGAQMKNIDDGEYAAYPAQGGWMEITVKAGLSGSTWVHKKGHNNNYWKDVNAKNVPINWLLYKAPEVTVVTSGLKAEEVSRDDIEYSGYINKDAKDDIDIDTICGTMEEICPTAKGVYLNTDSQEQVTTLLRGGYSNRAEKLLIGTLHSQYAERKTKLTGTRTLTGGGLKLLTDAMLGGVVMIETGATEDLGEETSESTAVELKGDEYQEG